MSTLLHWFTSPEWAQIVKTLLHSLWQGALIAVALAVFMRRLANPVSRYRCSLTALACVVVAGIITWAVITSSEGRAPLLVQIQPTAEKQTALNFAATMDSNPENKIIVIASRKSAVTPMRWTAWLALVWLAGAGVMLARAGVKVAGAEQLRRSCQPLSDARVEKLLAEARRAVGLARQVRVGVTDKLTSPAVVGVFVPMLILPLSLLTTLTPEQIHFVLLHELAHIRRGDYLANLFQFFAESLLFFNPAVWWISHQVRREREACCDALAIELSGAPVDYARTLVHVAENMLQPAPAAATAFSDKREPSSLIDRVQRLLVPGYRPSLRLTWRAMLAALVLGSVLLVLSATGTRMTVAAILPSNSPITPASSLDDTQSQHLPDITNAVTLVQDGKLLFEMGRLDQAEAKLKKAIAVEPDNQTALHYLDLIKNKRTTNKATANVPIDAGTSDLRTVLFKIDTYTGIANLQKLSGLSETSGLNEQLQKLLSEASVKPPLTNILITKEGMLVVRGTKEQRDLVFKVVMTLNGVSSNDSRTLTNEKPNLAEADTLVQDGKLLFEMGKLDQAEAKLRKALDLDPLNNAAAYYFNLVHEARFNVATSRRGSDAQTMVHTNLIYTSKGRQAIASKLDRIHLDSIVFPEGGLPLSEVLRNLSEESKKRDPEKRGINFIINSGVESAPAAASVEGGGGLPPLPAEPLDLGAVIVKLNPGLTDVRLADVLDAITKNAEKPIKYAIEDYAVVFSLKTDADSQPLFVRKFKVDPNVFLSNLGKQTGLTGTNTTDELKALLKVFSDAGADLQPPKSIFYNDRTGVLIVRATKEDLDIVETLLQVLNYSPPLVNIKARFIEMPDALAQSVMKEFSVTNYLNNRGISTVLTDPQAKELLKRFEQSPGVNILALPEVTTLSGRQAQVSVVDVKTIVTGLNTTVTNGETNYIAQTQTLPLGPVLDVLPRSSADEYTIHLTLIPSMTEFLGNDDPKTVVTNFSNGFETHAALPLPKFRKRQTETVAIVWDGQTIVLGNFKDEIISTKPDGSYSTNEFSGTTKKQLLVFVTPTLIDPAGNRMHTDEEMPGAYERVPVQTK